MNEYSKSSLDSSWVFLLSSLKEICLPCKYFSLGSSLLYTNAQSYLDINLVIHSKFPFDYHRNQHFMALAP